MSRRRILGFAVALVAVTLALHAAPSVANAQAPRGQPVYAQNNTDRPIWVAAKYMPAGERNFIVNGFWRVDPGQRVLMYYNNAVYNYMYARDDLGRSWRGNFTVTFRSESLSMFEVNTTDSYEPFTMSFNP